LLEEKEPDCVFCDIVAGKAEAHLIHEDALSMAILDIHPYTKGHCLVSSSSMHVGDAFPILTFF